MALAVPGPGRARMCPRTPVGSARRRILSKATQEPSRILVVDDEENLRNILEFQLRAEGFAVRGLGRGDETLATTLQWKPDLVLLDLMMPGMDGFSVCRALRGNESTQGLPVIVVTARGDAATRLQALVAGAHEFVVKPYAWDELLGRIRKAIELSRRHHGAPSFVGLPGSAATEAQIARLHHGTEDFAFLSLDVDHFRRFNEKFGYEKGDEVVRLLARLITEATESLEASVKFVAHLGGDEFVILVSPEVARPLADDLITRFDKESRRFFAKRDLDHGHYETVARHGRREMVPLLALTVALVDHVKQRDLQPRKLTDLAAELRAVGKARLGSIVVCERRERAAH
ncbi:MAG TPA: response regulator [Candidatus Krumholzibacteria bacterium]|nr:response regulator [Candidatus Krumholzibacteria bacterium]